MSSCASVPRSYRQITRQSWPRRALREHQVDDDALQAAAIQVFDEMRDLHGRPCRSSAGRSEIVTRNLPFAPRDVVDEMEADCAASPITLAISRRA